MRARVPGARDQHRCHSTPSSFHKFVFGWRPPGSPHARSGVPTPGGVRVREGWRATQPIFSLPPSQYWRGTAWRFPIVRASNEGLPRPRVARAQGIARLPFFPFFSLYSSSLVLEGVAKVALDCAHRTRAFLGRAFCEQGGHLAAPSPTLDPRSSAPVQYPLLLLTPWLSDCFLSSAAARRKGSGWYAD